MLSLEHLLYLKSALKTFSIYMKSSMLEGEDMLLIMMSIPSLEDLIQA